MLNDDYTPMEFVVEVLQTFFGMNGEKATQIMLMVHRTGKGTCGIFPKDIAETKCAQVNQYTQESQHPLSLRLNPRMMSDGIPSSSPNPLQKPRIKVAWLGRQGWQKEELIPGNGIGS